MKKWTDPLFKGTRRLIVIGLLCSATLISLLLFRVRTIMSGSADYAFLIWNILLAWIPFGIAYLTYVYAIKRRGLLLILSSAVLLWLVFLPNAPYIMTDLQHLAVPRPGIPVWFDMLLLIWFAWTGLLLGMVSLFMMHGIVWRTFGRTAGWVFVVAVGFLASLGIYIGRFLRWNSWDLFLNPLVRITEFMYYATHPSLRSILFIGTFSGFFLFVYFTLFAFGWLFQDQAKQVLEEV